MTNEPTVETPNSETEQSTSTVPTSQVAKKCLDVIEAYRKSGRKSADKAITTREILSALADTTPPLSESELNDTFGTYLSILPWVIREHLSDYQLGDSLRSTLKLLRIFARDLKFTKSSVINSPCAPPFPHSEWSNIIAGSMVDLDHVISGSFAITNDNCEIELLAGLEVKFGVSKPIKHVKTSGDWFIAWWNYTNAACYVFPHRKDEFDTYGSRTLSLFAATSTNSHASIISLDKSIRARAGECRNLLLTDQAAFEDLKLYWLNPIGAGGQPSGESSRKSGQGKKSDYRDNEPCLKWNANECSKRASECRHRHVCEICGKNHRKSECKGSKQGSA
jgi:hypothetical protein